VSGLIDAGLKEADMRYILMPLALAQRLTNTQAISGYTIKLSDPDTTQAFIARTKQAASAAGIEVDVTPWNEHHLSDLYRRAMDLLSTWRTLVLAVVMTVAGMSVFNTLVKSIAERTREIGTLRSIGFRRKHIVAMFAWESALLALLSASVGLVLTVVFSFAIDHAGITYDGGVSADPIPLRIAFVPGTYLQAAVFLCAIAVVATLLPARRAAAMRIPDALGHT
jgi:putative ABC transport system permease protein